MNIRDTIDQLAHSETFNVELPSAMAHTAPDENKKASRLSEPPEAINFERCQHYFSLKRSCNDSFRILARAVERNGTEIAADYRAMPRKGRYSRNAQSDAFIKGLTLGRTNNYHGIEPAYSSMNPRESALAPALPKVHARRRLAGNVLSTMPGLIHHRYTSRLLNRTPEQPDSPEIANLQSARFITQFSKGKTANSDKEYTLLRRLGCRTVWNSLTTPISFYLGQNS